MDGLILEKCLLARCRAQSIWCYPAFNSAPASLAGAGMRRTAASKTTRVSHRRLRRARTAASKAREGLSARVCVSIVCTRLRQDDDYLGFCAEESIECKVAKIASLHSIELAAQNACWRGGVGARVQTIETS